MAELPQLFPVLLSEDESQEQHHQQLLEQKQHIEKQLAKGKQQESFTITKFAFNSISHIINSIKNFTSPPEDESFCLHHVTASNNEKPILHICASGA
eukprot:Pgem_evm1s15429